MKIRGGCDEPGMGMPEAVFGFPAEIQWSWSGIVQDVITEAVHDHFNVFGAQWEPWEGPGDIQWAQESGWELWESSDDNSL